MPHGSASDLPASDRSCDIAWIRRAIQFGDSCRRPGITQVHLANGIPHVPEPGPLCSGRPASCRSPPFRKRSTKKPGATVPPRSKKWAPLPQPGDPLRSGGHSLRRTGWCDPQRALVPTLPYAAWLGFLQPSQTDLPDHTSASMSGRTMSKLSTQMGGQEPHLCNFARYARRPASVGDLHQSGGYGGSRSRR